MKIVITDLLSLLKYLANLNPIQSLIATIIFGILSYYFPISLALDVSQQFLRVIFLILFIIFIIFFSWNLITWYQANKIKKAEREKANQEKKEQEEIQRQIENNLEIESKFTGLYTSSKVMLKDFLENNENPKDLWVDDETVQQLESKGIIEKVAPVTIGSAKIKMCSYKLTSWAWEYLQKNQHVIKVSYNDIQNFLKLI